MSDSTWWERWCKWWKPFLYSVHLINTLILNDFLMYWFPKFHKNRFFPWINQGRRHPLYIKTGQNRPLSILIMLGHPQPMFMFEHHHGTIDRNELQKEAQSQWLQMTSANVSCVSHLSTKCLLDHLEKKLKDRVIRDRRERIASNEQLRDQSTETRIDHFVESFNGFLNDNLDISTLYADPPSLACPIFLEIVHLRPTNDLSLIGSEGVILTKSEEVLIKYREVLINPLNSLTSKKQYKAGNVPCQDGDDEILVQKLIQVACHLVFIYPIFWFDVPAPLKACLDRIFTPGRAFVLLPDHPLLNLMIWMMTPISMRLQCLLRFFNSYGAHGLLRDKQATLIETRGGPHSAVFGHTHTTLETTLRFCGISVKSVASLEGLDTYNATDLTFESTNVYQIPKWYSKWDKKLSVLNHKIAEHCIWQQSI